MDELISRKKAIQAAIKGADPYYADSIEDEINGVPSAQPEIVRCCDCKYFVSECHYCDYFQWNITCDNFCSKAERREATT